MMRELYDVKIVPDAVLRETATPVTDVTADIAAQMDRMLATMYAAHGIGLAANQVGLTNRVIVMDLQDRGGGGPDKPYVMANPEIIAASDDVVKQKEGCLSLPGSFADVKRPAEITVRYLDRDGNEQEMSTGGLLSACIQHEIDHLNGVLFVDHLSRIKRDMILRKFDKRRR